MRMSLFLLFVVLLTFRRICCRVWLCLKFFTTHKHKHRKEYTAMAKNKRIKRSRTTQPQRRMSHTLDENSSFAQNKTGGIAESVRMPRVFRYGSSLEKSRLLDLLVESSASANSRFMLQCVVFPDEKWISEVVGQPAISTYFSREKDSMYDVEIGFVLDEICRMIVHGRNCVITMIGFSDDPVEVDGVVQKYSTGKMKNYRDVNAWIVAEKYNLVGMHEDIVRASYSEDHETGKPITPDDGDRFHGSENIGPDRLKS